VVDDLALQALHIARKRSFANLETCFQKIDFHLKSHSSTMITMSASRTEDLGFKSPPGCKVVVFNPAMLLIKTLKAFQSKYF
jgi:hypothetical protein